VLNLNIPPNLCQCPCAMSLPSCPSSENEVLPPLRSTVSFLHSSSLSMPRLCPLQTTPISKYQLHARHIELIIANLLPSRESRRRALRMRTERGGGLTLVRRTEPHSRGGPMKSSRAMSPSGMMKSPR
jgi:hypothetical protein